MDFLGLKFDNTLEFGHSHGVQPFAFTMKLVCDVLRSVSSIISKEPILWSYHLAILECSEMMETGKQTSFWMVNVKAKQGQHLSPLMGDLKIIITSDC